MNNYPIKYTFNLKSGGTTIAARPLWGDGLSLDYSKQSGEEFFRAKLAGELTFTADDYDFILAQAFDAQFVVEIYISYDGGATSSLYWTGIFYRTDCAFDRSAKTCVVTPTTSDRYEAVLAGLEKEYNLLDLAPEIIEINADKRPMIQVYIPGQKVVGCFLSGMWWEQECEPTPEADMGNYYFSLNKSITTIQLPGGTSPALPEAVQAEQGKYFNFISGGFRFIRSQVTNLDNISISDADSGVIYWNNPYVQRDLEGEYQVVLSPVNGVGYVTLQISTVSVYARYVTDVEAGTYPMPSPDIVPDNRNYRRVLGYYVPDTIVGSIALTPNATKWGIFQPGSYYQSPANGLTIFDVYPISRNAWGRASYWFNPFFADHIAEQQWRAPFTIRDAFPIWSVISVLLGKIAPGVTHKGNTTYSQFLYGTNLIGYEQTIAITPKSNIISSGYDQPAQQATITLRKVLDMLRDCFRCYWFIDSSNRFCIEHIEYFRRGGSYYGSPVVGVNLTTMRMTRSTKTWAYGQEKYKYEKVEMPARYQFGWMDEVTQLFEGFPMDIVSGYVDKERIEQITLTDFTSDIDYILLNPSVISKDGFVLLAAIDNGGTLELPYYDFVIDSVDHWLQNAYVSFMFLQKYYVYDMPAPQYIVNGETKYAIGTKRLKSQEVTFPALTDPNLQNLIETNIGKGEIRKLSVSLSSRQATATLNYDTEQ